MNWINRVVGIIGYVVDAYTARENGRYEDSSNAINHAVEVLLFGKPVDPHVKQRAEYVARGGHIEDFEEYRKSRGA